MTTGGPRPSIVVLDGWTLNPGDLSWDGLRALGASEIYDRTDPADLLQRARDVAVLLTNKTQLSGDALQQLSALRYVGVLATGHDVVDAAAATARGITVCNVPAYGTPSVAQHTFALILELANQVGRHAEASRSGRWSASGEFSYTETALTELAGLTLGIVGLGRIGQAVSRIALAFGMQVIARSSKPEPPAGLDVRLVEIDELFESADVLSLHCPLTPKTAGLVSASRLSRMKPGAWLINTARGALVDEAALLAALHAGRLGAAALDVLAQEPPEASHPLLHAPRCIVTPHAAWATRAARQRLLDVAVDNVRAFLAGSPQNVVQT